MRLPGNRRDVTPTCRSLDGAKVAVLERSRHSNSKSTQFWGQFGSGRRSFSVRRITPDTRGHVGSHLRKARPRRLNRVPGASRRTTPTCIFFRYRSCLITRPFPLLHGSPFNRSPASFSREYFSLQGCVFRVFALRLPH